jgi:hypothetical protein
VNIVVTICRVSKCTIKITVIGNIEIFKCKDSIVILEEEVSVITMKSIIQLSISVGL